MGNVINTNNCVSYSAIVQNNNNPYPITVIPSSTHKASSYKLFTI